LYYCDCPQFRDLFRIFGIEGPYPKSYRALSLAPDFGYWKLHLPLAALQDHGMMGLAEVKIPESSWPYPRVSPGTSGPLDNSSCNNDALPGPDDCVPKNSSCSDALNGGPVSKRQSSGSKDTEKGGSHGITLDLSAVLCMVLWINVMTLFNTNSTKHCVLHPLSL
jgi:hypothetical protein